MRVWETPTTDPPQISELKYPPPCPQSRRFSSGEINITGKPLTCLLVFQFNPSLVYE